MSIEDYIKEATNQLEKALVESARLDVEILLADILHKDRSWILTHPEFELDANTYKILASQIDSRAKHVPLAYIRGRQEFYGQEFIVTPDVLTPRPETETMIELLLSHIKDQKPTSNKTIQIIDVGAGSGCIAISAIRSVAQIVSSRHKIDCTGLDVSDEALKVAQQNAEKLDANVSFRHFDITKDNLASVIDRQTQTYVLANLPYVPNDYPINKAATHEPAVALFADENGLQLYKSMFEQLKGLTDISIFTESLSGQHQDLIVIADKTGYRLIQNQDLIHLFRPKLNS